MYSLIPDTPTMEQVAALPDEALLPYAEVLSVLELKPWAGRSLHEAHPDDPSDAGPSARVRPVRSFT